MPTPVHDPAHDPLAAPHDATGAAAQRPLTLVFALTAAYMVVEAVAGFVTGSLALVADAGHMLADVLGLGMALGAIRFARRAATPGRTYGFYRAEVLAALGNSLLLFGIAAYVLLEAWHRLTDPAPVDALPMVVVAAGGLVVNLIGVRLLHRGARHNLNVRGAFLEVLADLLGSVGALAAGTVIALTRWWPADPLASLVIALFVVPRAWRLLRSALDVLLESTPSHIDLARLEGAMRTVPGVTSVHDLHVWTISSGFVAMSAHVEAQGRRSHEVLHDLQALLRREFRIEHATLQVEQPGHADDGACCAMDPRCLVVGSEATELTRR